MADTRIPNVDPSVTQPNLGISGAATGIYDLIRGIQGRSIDESRTAAAAADPFAQQRGGYQTDLRTSIDNPQNSYMGRLNDLLSNPGSFKADPGYQFALDQGLEGVARHGNAMFGTTRSGNTAIELDKFGTGFAEQAFDTRVNQLLAGAGQEEKNYNDRIQSLLTASGANQGSPGTAGALLGRGFENRNSDIAGGARGIDQLLRMLGLGGSGGGGIGGGGSGGISNVIRQLFGGSSGDLSGSDEEFLRSIGIDPANVGGDFGIDPDTYGRIHNVIDLPGGDNLSNFDYGDVSDSTGNLLDSIGGIGGP